MDEATAQMIPPAFNMREPTDPRVWIVEGYGIKIVVRSGHLTVTDGRPGEPIRLRRIPRADRSLRRIVVIGQGGYVSLEALRFCQDHRIAVITLDPYGELVSVSQDSSNVGGTTIRAQALCAIGGPQEQAGLEICRIILKAKLDAQANVGRETFDSQYLWTELNRYAVLMDTAQTLQELSGLEARSTRLYFRAWRKVSMNFRSKDMRKIPLGWLSWQGRKSSVSNENHHASDPINSMLNYGYAILESEARLACLSTGLSPALGFLHLESQYRDSLALDVMEAGRPLVDRFILEMLRSRTFRYDDFSEVRYGSMTGTVRIINSLSHEIASEGISWAASLYPVTEKIVQVVSLASRGKFRARRQIPKTRIPQYDQMARPWERIVPQTLWDQIRPLAESLPYPPQQKQVGRRMVIAALLYSRMNQIPYTKVPASFGISPRTIGRRFADWKEQDAWQKIEAIAWEHRS
jgi:CRISPR-associated endonuclease Cas1